jgi:DNA-binding IclR family transcriptional regulator
MIREEEGGILQKDRAKQYVRSTASQGCRRRTDRRHSSLPGLRHEVQRTRGRGFVLRESAPAQQI